jgi:ubiquitin conjugation factor E4 A
LPSFDCHLHCSRNSEQLFTDHPLKSELIPTLIHVFVSIEISDGLTGETVNVAFEQKFGYRKPMYTVLKYLWSKAEHRKRMKEMADFAQNNMEAISPPLFLRFINLLMNDAIFLLDEALTYMSKLKELQIQRDGGEWAKLPAQQREQNEQNFQHTSRLATFHNIMGCNTIHTLSWITEEIKSIFCDKTLVERMASMLNYFLLHLVGPQNRALKVKDLKQFEFKPKDLVHDICRMYVNLANEDNDKRRKFCLAVGMDDRSYSADLFTLASDVLIKSGFIGLSNETQEVAKLVDKVLQLNKRREIDMEEVSDELMSCLMTDPVILPNSGIRIDRSTIARHLLRYSLFLYRTPGVQEEGVRGSARSTRLRPQLYELTVQTLRVYHLVSHI